VSATATATGAHRKSSAGPLPPRFRAPYHLTNDDDDVTIDDDGVTADDVILSSLTGGGVSHRYRDRPAPEELGGAAQGEEGRPGGGGAAWLDDCLSPLGVYSVCMQHQVTWCAPLAAIDTWGRVVVRGRPPRAVPASVDVTFYTKGLSKHGGSADVFCCWLS
jgi:hypothetical protein